MCKRQSELGLLRSGVISIEFLDVAIQTVKPVIQAHFTLFMFLYDIRSVLHDVSEAALKACPHVTRSTATKKATAVVLKATARQKRLARIH